MFHKMIAFRRERKKEREKINNTSNVSILKIFFLLIEYLILLKKNVKKKSKLFTLLNLFNY